MTLTTEILTKEELADLTGRAHRASQIEWLGKNRWKYETNAAGDPIVGRWYTRIRLAGIDIAHLAPEILPDFSKVR